MGGTQISQPDSYRELLSLIQQQYDQGLADQQFSPFVLPYNFLNYGLLISYILFSRHELIRRARYPIFGLIVWHSVSTVRECRSIGMAYGIGIGLVSVWCIIWSATLMIFNDPYHEFKRIVRRLNLSPPSPPSFCVSTSTSSIKRQVLQSCNEENASSLAATPLTQSTKSMTTKNSGGILVWEPMPTSFFRRLDWTLDLISSFRGLNWSWKFRDPSKASPQALVPLQQQPHIRSLSSSLLHFFSAYILIDILKVVMMADPYFWGFIESPAPEYLPLWVSSVDVLRTYRALLSFAGIWTAIYLIFSLGTLVLRDTLGPTLLGVHGEHWMYPSGYGSVYAVLDRGLVGFWGSWWHQIFRFAFVSPGHWILRRLDLAQGSGTARWITFITAFILSGVVHASGTYTLWQTASPLGPLFFFLLQPVGLALQGLIERSGSVLRLPIPFSRLLRVTLLISWFWLTFPLLADGLAGGGMWLFEPLPVSILRGLGWSTIDWQWWCWHGPFARWHVDKRWWRTGFAL
jgi:hypothetical protein